MIKKDKNEYIYPGYKIVDSLLNLNFLKKECVLIHLKDINCESIIEKYGYSIFFKYEKKILEIINYNFKFIENFKIFYIGAGEYILLFFIEKQEKKTIIEKIKNKKLEINNLNIKINNANFNISLIFVLTFEYNIDLGRDKIKNAILEKKDFITNDFSNSKNFYICNNNKKTKKNTSNKEKCLEIVKNSQIVPFIQPIVDNKTKNIVKYEALLRLRDNNGIIYPPHLFLEEIQNTSYYQKITLTMINQAFAFLKNIKNVNISINISYNDIENQIVKNNIFQSLKENQTIANRLTFEILENEKIKDTKLIKEFIETVKKYKVTIAIDDFGRGYSNFNRILKIKPDLLKIDGNIIKKLDSKCDYSYSILKNIVNFTKEQGLKTIAEFVENENIYKEVKKLGINYSQGYFFGKPIPITEKLSV